MLVSGVLQMNPVSAFCLELGWHERSTTQSQRVPIAHSDLPFGLLVQWPWLLTMKLELDPPTASCYRQKPLWCYAEHTLPEYAIQVQESPTDCLTPTVSTNTLWLCRDSFWVVTYDTQNPKEEMHSSTSLNEPFPNYAALRCHTYPLCTWIQVQYIYMSLILFETSYVCLDMQYNLPCWGSVLTYEIFVHTNGIFQIAYLL